MFRYYSTPPGRGAKTERPHYTANFGVKLQEKLRTVPVECHLMYPGATGVPWPDPIQFLIAMLKGAKP